MVQGGGVEMPFPPILCVFVLSSCPVSVHLQDKYRPPCGCLIIGPKINLVADYSPGGSLRDPPPRALRAPEPPGQGGRLPPPGDGGHLTDFVPN